jgi:hypothetical protein
MAPAQKRATLAAGAVAPDFVMRDINGKEVRLADFQGQGRDPRFLGHVVRGRASLRCRTPTSSPPNTGIRASWSSPPATSDTIAKFKEWIPKNQPKYPALQFVFDPHERGSATFEERGLQQTLRRHRHPDAVRHRPRRGDHRHHRGQRRQGRRPAPRPRWPRLE